MKTTIHHAEDRGKGEYDWLSTRYSFSFANWYNPARMGFGALRVINDDTIAPANGFGAHSHDNMEIITIVTSGTLTHKDSLGNTGTVQAGEVQVMSAGTGVTHAEYNDSKSEPLTLFQIWILPSVQGVAPRYDQKSYEPVHNGIIPLVGPVDENDVLSIHQYAYIYRANITGGSPLQYIRRKEGNGMYVFVVNGNPTVAGVILKARDALGIEDAETVPLSSDTDAELLIIEVPMR